jgi:regulator of replication initiation timing
MDTKELEAKITELQKELETVKARPADVKVEVPKELSEQIAALEQQNKELAARLKKVEEAPAPAATAPGGVKELGEVETLVVIDKETKTVRGI